MLRHRGETEPGVKTKSEEYRRSAATCLRLADEIADPDVRATLVEMARGWHALAKQAEHNGKLDLVYEPPPAQSGEQRIAQQQQQIQPKNDEGKR